ncbi:unnamed protein product [Bursaphelenchus xylophilus]|uniref:(pine wood nematode) hypothetical protein n=1 Tax=Bursaphelenchus xylophilus TaxID=6326 RepID=A0A1I7S462_BURXY|nr:unnamed protein product [Bursaphelenchus xylophilus]CAG9116757.1 unnamed protein product [Bursaphelenchus xylophilus]
MTFLERIRSEKNQQNVVIFTVYISMLLNFFLLTVVVPILPNHLLLLNNETEYLQASLHRDNESTFDYEDYHEAFASNNIPLAVLMSSKAIAQIPTSVIVSWITYRIGYDIPLFVGFVIFTISSLLFAYSETYNMLLIARSLSGIGCGFGATAGLGMLANAFPDYKKRTRAMAIVFSGIAIGTLLGPVLGGILYRYGGIVLPFTLLAGVSFFVGLVQLVVLPPKVSKVRPEHTNYWDLLSDPYLMLTATAIFMNNFSFSALEPTMPLWMLEVWGSSSVDQGLAFFPSSVSYIIWTYCNKHVVKFMGQWKCALLGFVVLGVCLIVLPFSPNLCSLLVVSAFLGMGFGLVGLNMFPLMGHIADLRHTQIYGSVYAISDVSCSLAFVSGPIAGGPAVRYLGFTTMLFFLGMVNFAFAPLMIFLRKLEKTKHKNMLAAWSSAAIVPEIPVISEKTKNFGN